MQAAGQAKALQPSPEYTSSPISQFLFGWVGPLFTKGNKVTLTQNDLLGVAEGDDPEKVSREFERLLDERIRLNDPQPVRSALIAQFKAPMVKAGVVKFCNSTLQFAPSLLLYGLLSSLQSGRQSMFTNLPPWSGYVFAVAMFVALVVRTCVENAYFHMVMRVGFRIRTALTTAVYRKALRMSPTARQESPVGQIVNLMQLDASRLDTLMNQLHVSWDAWYQILGYMALLGFYVGPSCLAGLGTMLLLMPVQGYMMGVMGKYRRVIAKATDQRIKVTNEVLQGIRAVKLYSWEDAYGEIVGKAREDELKAIRDYAYMAAINSTIMNIAPTVVAVVTLLVYAGTGGDFSAARVFSAISVLNQIRFPLMFLPSVIQQIADAKVSLGRLDRFVKQPEVEGYTRQLTNAAAAASKDVTASPSADSVAVAVSGHSSPVASSSASAPSSEVGISVSGATFHWEDPEARVVRLKKKAEEERKAKEAAEKKKGKGKKPAAAAPAPAPASASSRSINVQSTTPVATPAAAAAAGEQKALTVDTSAPSTPSATANAPSPIASTSSKASNANAEPWTVAVPAALKDVNFTVPKGQLYAVIGSVGSGKSALCSAILGELSKAGGDVSVGGRIAYVAQTAWILNGSLKRNVTFAYEAATGKAPEEDRYQRILDVCQLRRDISVLIDGDATEIGERGINLSGGQRQRVSVARAAYSGADVILFDDPLSALDAEVGKALFEQCIAGELKGTTRLLVTNQLQYLRQCDGIIVLERGSDGAGRVAMQGAYADLINVPAFADMLKAYGESTSASSSSSNSSEKSGSESPKAESPKAAASTAETPKPIGKPAAAAAATADPAKPAAAAATGGATKLMTIEEKNEGAVPAAIWWRYFKVAGWVWATVTVLLTAYAINQMAQLVSQWWITWWTSDPLYIRHPLSMYEGVFAALGVAGGIFAYIRAIVQLFASIRSSRALHKQLLYSILHAPLAFFDTTPLGRVLARFSKDVDAIDNQIAMQLGMLGMSIFFLIGSLAAIIFSTPWFALTIPVVIVIYLRIMNYFRNVAREVKRYDSITRSPIYAHFSESLGGLSTIRAYGLGSYFAAENERRVAANISSWYTLKACDRWLSIRLENLGNFVVLAAALLAVGTNSNRGEGTAAGLAGFSLSFAMAVTGLANWLVRTFSEAEQQMNSVERTTHYIDNVVTEPYDVPPPPAPCTLPPKDGSAVVTSAAGKEQPPIVDVSSAAAANAAEMGAITALKAYNTSVDLTVAPPDYESRYGSRGMKVEFKGYRMAYRPDCPEVLKGVDFTVLPGEQVGVVGRTGSGKSSLMVSLFRLIADQCTDGAIELDGVPTRTISLKQLRRALAIIPQDAVMFSGTIRSNLDPVGAVAAAAKKAHPHDPAAAKAQADETLWGVLEKVGLKDVIEARAGGLDAPVAELGEGYSQGQRQLLALARILVRPARLVLLDEASSSLDHVSDAALQRALRDAFPGHTATMLVIAHRLNTIIACDKVLVMDGGLVAEYAHPHVLLSNPSSLFSGLVDEMGEQTAASLRRAAAEAYEKSAGAAGVAPSSSSATE